MKLETDVAPRRSETGEQDYGPKARRARERLLEALGEPTELEPQYTEQIDEPVSKAESARARLRAALDGESEPQQRTPEPTGRPIGIRRKLSSLVQSSRRSTRVAVVVVLVVILVFGGSFFWLRSGKSLLGMESGEGVLSFLPTWLPRGVAFEYGDNDITVDQLDKQVDTMHALYGVQVPADQKRLAQFRKDAAKSYVVSLVLDKAAKDNGLQVADKTARDTLSKFVAQKLGDGPDAYSKFVSALGNQGTNEQAVVQELKRRLALSRLFDKVTADVPAVNDQDVRSAFTKRRAQLATPEKRQISNIVVQDKASADSAISQIRSGKPFDAVARQVSRDASTREQGGALGAVTKDQLDAKFGGAAFAAGQGTVFGPVQSKYGWNVGEVTGITPPQPAQFDKVKDQLKQDLQMQRALGKWRSWLTGKLDDADVRYADEYRPVDPTAPPGDAASGGSPIGGEQPGGR
ncbi:MULTISPECIES: peptidylprolyl isomerase [Sciscionella]|uniref:peptidylprolyl isomerase n=1 Tax=Sciscionella TaxID=596495 RepID=UPI00036901AE|nr:MULTISPECIES: peptidylprolyl isomerase [Sciscionella]